MKKIIFIFIFSFPFSVKASEVLLTAMPVKNSNFSVSSSLIEKLSEHLSSDSRSIHIDTLGSSVPSGGKQSLPEALKQAEELQLNFKYDEAIEVVSKILERVENSKPTLEDLRALADAYLYIAYLHKCNGHQADMLKSLRLAAHYNPSLIPDEMSFPPSLTTDFEKVKDGVWAADHFGEVLIHAATEGAEIFVNGAFKGLSPLKVNRLPSGQHHFVARSNGHEAYSKLQIKEGANPDIVLKTFSSKSPSVSADSKKEIASGDKKAMKAWVLHRVQARQSHYGCGVATLQKKKQHQVCLHCVSPQKALHQDFNFSSDSNPESWVGSVSLAISSFGL